jgi:uncharacterized protein (DUF433 family)
MPAAARRAAQESDLRSQPAYGLAEAARYVKLPTATLRSWVVGRAYPTSAGEGRFQPIIHPAGHNPLLVSFWNLIEAHVLRALRTEHGISIKEVRQAIRFAERQLGIERLLLRKELCTQAGMLFLDRYGGLINLSKSGQLAMRQVLEQHLKRVEWDEWKFPVRLYPFVSPDGTASEKPIAIDPAIAFGRPVVVRAGVSTAAVADRVDAGERLEDIAEDYGLTVPEVEQAVVFERAA